MVVETRAARARRELAEMNLRLSMTARSGGDKVVIDVDDKDDVAKIGDVDVVKVCKDQIATAVADEAVKGGDDVGVEDDVAKSGSDDVVKVCNTEIVAIVSDEAVKGGDDVGGDEDLAKRDDDDVTEACDNKMLAVVSDKAVYGGADVGDDDDVAERGGCDATEVCDNPMLAVVEGGADVSDENDVAERGGGDVTQVCGNQVMTVVSGENNELATVDNSGNVVTNGNGEEEMAAGVDNEGSNTTQQVALNEETIDISYAAYEAEPTRITTSDRLTLPYSAATTALHHEIERLRAAPPHFHSYIEPLDQELTRLVRHLIGAPIVAVTSLQQYEYLSDRLQVAIPKFACLHTSPDLAAILLLAASQQIRAFPYV